MTGKRVLITGASGFTGKHLVAAAAEEGLECLALCRSAGEEVPGAAEKLVADLSDTSGLANALSRTAPDYVIHLAAVSFVAHDDVGEIYRANVEGTVNLASAISRELPDFRRLVVASSANIYGRTRDLPIRADHPITPVNHYGLSKATMERAIALFADLPCTIVRPFNYTGRGQSTRFLVPKIVAAFRERAPEITLGNLDVARDFSDVRDICRGYLRLLDTEVKGGIINMCSGAATSLADIVRMLEELTSHNIEIRSDPRFVRSDDIPVLYGDSGPFDSLLGPTDRHGLEDTLAWMLDNH